MTLARRPPGCYNGIMELQSPDRNRHHGAITGLFAQVFSDYWDWYDYMPDGYLDDSPYDWGASRVGMVDGELATHFGAAWRW